MLFFRPPHWQSSPHGMMETAIYRQAAFQVVNNWAYEACHVRSLPQARRDLSCLAITSLNIHEKSLFHQARFWHAKLPLRSPLREPLAGDIRGFFESVFDDEGMLTAISLSDRALSVFNLRDIELVAERIAAAEDNICAIIESLHP